MLGTRAARLLAVDGTAPVTRLLVLGRHKALVGSAHDSHLRIAGISVRQASIEYRGGRYFVRDLKSEDGTFLNGRRVRRARRLTHGDQLRFDEARYRFIDPDGRRRVERRRYMLVAETAALAIVCLGAYLKFGRAHRTEPAGVASVRAAEQPTPPQVKVARQAPADPAPASAPVTAPDWLQRINSLRAMAGLGALRENSALDTSVVKHSHYLLANYAAQIRDGGALGAGSHSEDPAKSGYSSEGAQAAANSQIAWGCSSYDAAHQIDQWFAGPFHRLAMLNPSLSEAAFGEASSDGCWVAALRLPPPGAEVKPYEHAIEFPPPGSNISLTWIGVEFPDPLASCPDYSTPAGLPITLQLGHLTDAALTAHSLSKDGAPVEHCAFDATSYKNPEASAQEYGRWALRSEGAVVMIPRAPRIAGGQYAVSITAHGQTYTWSFKATE